MHRKSSSRDANRGFVNVPVSVLVLWFMVVITVPVWVMHSAYGWDLEIYGKALQSLQAGHDPYSDAIAVQNLHHRVVLANGGVDPDIAPPYSYVYSPITLPLLGALGRMPLWLLLALYWTVYAAGAVAAIFVGFRMGEPDEARVLLYCAGVAAFFPGLLANGVLLSGNIAYILYGAVLSTALLGWNRGRWLPFYLAVLCASCVKAPFLSFALVPALSARRQWWSAAALLTAGLGLFGLQPLIWPSLFKHYLQAVELQFSYNHDFGCSPAGLFSQLLDARGLHYAPWCYFFYAAYALPVFAGLLYLRQRFLHGDFPLTRWAPVLLVGILLLNPRIQEYDAAPFTLPLALIAWRYARTRRRPSRWIFGMLTIFALTLVSAILAETVFDAGPLYNWQLRKALDGPLMVTILFAGMWQLFTIVRRMRGRSLFQGAEERASYTDRVQKAAEHAVTFAASSAVSRSA